MIRGFSRTFSEASYFNVWMPPWTLNHFFSSENKRCREKKTLTNSGKDRIVPESESVQSTNYFRILSGLIWGYFMVFWEPPFFTDINHSL